jgi:hypothetical protein
VVATPGRNPTDAATAAPSLADDPSAVERAYRAFWPLLATFDRQHPASNWRTVLERVATDPQLSQAIAVARQQRQIGVRLYGQPQPRAPLVTLDRSATATVSDCADFSRYGQADAKTGKPRTAGAACTRVTATLVRNGIGRWRVAEVSYPGGTC